MRVIRTDGRVGITDIFTPDHPPGRDDFEPKKKPYLLIKLPLSMVEDVMFFTSLGSAYYNDEQTEMTIAITGHNNVKEAIGKFLSLPEYKNSKNAMLHIRLTRYGRKIIEQIKKKKPTTPRKSKDESRYQATPDARLMGTGNPTYMVYNKDKPHKLYFWKHNQTGRLISQIEVFNGYCHRLLLGDRHPKVSNLSNSTKKRVGVLSEVVPGFTSVDEFFQRNQQKINKQLMLDTEIVKVWVSAYVEEEVDMHNRNYGFSHSVAPSASHPMYAVKIDDDRSTWPLTSKYVGIDPDLPHDNFPTSPNTTFKFSERDIRSFPILNDSTPVHWVTHPDNQSLLFAPNAIDDLSKEDKYQNDKYYLFLKRILMPDSAYKAIGIAAIGSEKTRKKFVARKCHKTKELTRLLLNIPEFQDYLIKNKTISAQLRQEFSDYNADFKKPEDASLKIDIAAVLNRLDKLTKEADKRLHPSFFTRYPVARDVLIGVAAGIVLAGFTVSIVVSFGATLGLTLGGLAVLGGSLAATIGMGAGAVAGVGMITAGVGAIIRKLRKPVLDQAKKSDKKPTTTHNKLHQSLGIHQRANNTTGANNAPGIAAADNKSNRKHHSSEEVARSPHTPRPTRRNSI